MLKLIVWNQTTNTTVCNFHINNHREKPAFCPDPFNVPCLVKKAQAVPKLLIIGSRYSAIQFGRLDPTAGRIPECIVKNFKDLDLNYMKGHNVILSQRDISSQFGGPGSE